MGNCAQGTETCSNGVWGPCSIVKQSSDACNVGDDGNCNGTKNDGCPCVDGARQSCGPPLELGECRRGTQTCVDSKWGDCIGAVLAKARDCSSGLDLDCDGLPDNKVDALCTCSAGVTEDCDTHPGKDGKGPCRAGKHTCVVSLDKKSSSFDKCLGPVAPAATDTCEAGNDNNCNGVVNEGCACVNGSTMPCGAPMAIGICKPGVQTCTGSVWTGCNAVFATGRDCTKPTDNDCNGTPDSSDSTCECVVDAVRDCTTALQGPCKPGKQKCVLSSDRKSTSWGTCTGLAPALNDTCDPGNDANCDGTPNGKCACVNGTTKPCPKVAGVCTAGNQQCVNSAWGSECIGQVLAGGLDCTKAGDNNCNGVNDQTEPPCTVCPLGSTPQACAAPGAFGPCANGTRTCVADANKQRVYWTACMPRAKAEADGCNPPDDADCDGNIGEGCCTSRTCGTTCCGGAALPPNTVAGCSGSTCTTPCKDPLGCSTSAGANCGSWTFNSGTEGWTIGAETTVTGVRLSVEQGQLAATFTAGAPSFGKLQLEKALCGGASGTSVDGKTLHYRANARVTSGSAAGDRVADVYPWFIDSASGAGWQVASDQYLFPGTELVDDSPANTQLKTATHVRFDIAIVAPVSGVILLDDVIMR